MKTNLTFIVVVICMIFAASGDAAQKRESHDMQSLHGVVESVNGNKITVNYRRKSQTFTIHDKTKINYVSFLKAKEFATVIGTTAHLDTRFKQADKDRSGDISVEELAGFIDTISCENEERQHVTYPNLTNKVCWQRSLSIPSIARLRTPF